LRLQVLSLHHRNCFQRIPRNKIRAWPLLWSSRSAAPCRAGYKIAWPSFALPGLLITLKDKEAKARNESMILKKSVSKHRFKELTYPHMTLVYNLALKYTGNAFDAEDIVQETYMMAFNKFHQLKDPSKCKPWLIRILRNNFLKTCQKSKSRQRLLESEYVEYLKQQIRTKDAEDLIVKQASDRIVKEAIDRLPVKYREVLMLYYMDEMLYKDIAQTLDIPMGTVMSRLTRAREGLKTDLLKQMKRSGNNILDFKLPWKQDEL